MVIMSSSTKTKVLLFLGVEVELYGFKKIGRFIAQCRKEKNLTQQNLADELLTVRETVSKWERGIYTPSNEMLLKLGQLFDVSINEILCGEKTNQDNQINCKFTNQAVNNKKIFRITLIFITIIILLSIIFICLYRFINNSHFSVYKIYGGDDIILLNDGVMIVSDKENYIQIGNIDNLSKFEIKKIILYYIHDNERIDIFSSSQDKNNYNKLFRYDDLIKAKNDLYIEFEFINNTTHILKLSYETDI